MANKISLLAQIEAIVPLSTLLSLVLPLPTPLMLEILLQGITFPQEV
jgi:hypothetical protein